MSFFKWIDRVFGSESDPENFEPKNDEEDYRIIEFGDDRFYLCINENHDVPTYLISEIKDAVYEDGRLMISFENSSLELYSTDIYFHHLIKKLPAGLKSFDYKRFDQFYANLQGCQICGLMARNGTKCLACEYDETEYLKHDGLEKEQQLNHFAMWFPITGKLENHSFGGFPLDPNWKLLVTKEEYEAWINPEPETF